MRTALFLTLTAVVFIGAASCRSISERTVHDTEGRAFVAKCDRGGACELTQTEGPGEHTKSVVTALGRLVAVCPAGEGATPPAGECRALVCKEDSDCPPAHGLKDGACVNGLCINAASEVTREDSVALCLSGTGLGRSSPEQIERYALGLNCGTPCKVPRNCRQP